MSTELAKVFDMTQERFVSVASSEMKYEAEKGFAMQILTNNSYMMKIALENKASLAQAITNVAAINLSLNPAEKQAYLISRTVKEGNSFVGKIFLEPSYMGLCKIATDSGSIKWVQANCVYASDTFMDNGPGLRPTHQYNAFGQDRGEFVGVYCVAKTNEGDFLTTLMDSTEVNGIMERSEAVKAHRKGNGKGGPWMSDFKEQAKKSVVRRAFKMWPRSNMNRMSEAVHLSNENEGFQPIVNNPDITTFTPLQKEFFDKLIEKNDALSMYVFSCSFDLTDASGTGAGIWISLCHSFEKGTKGKYQEVVNTLRSKGEQIFADYLCEIEANLGGDDTAVLELIAELDNAAIKLIESRLNSEMVMEFNKLTK